MRFSVSLWDELFGKRSTISVPLPDGTVREVRVTEKWWKQMIEEGKISPVAPGHITVHHYDALAGYSMQKWKVGEDIDQDSVDRFLDPDEQALYAMTVYKAGEEKSMVLKKAQWEEWRDKFEHV